MEVLNFPADLHYKNISYILSKLKLLFIHKMPVIFPASSCFSSVPSPKSSSPTSHKSMNRKTRTSTCPTPRPPVWAGRIWITARTPAHRSTAPERIWTTWCRGRSAERTASTASTVTAGGPSTPEHALTLTNIWLQLVMDCLDHKHFSQSVLLFKIHFICIPWIQHSLCYTSALNFTFVCSNLYRKQLYWTLWRA